MAIESLKFALIFYLFVIAITAILPDSNYFRKTISFPFQIVYLIVRLLLTAVTFGKVKLPRLQRKAAQNLRRITPEPKREGYLDSKEKGWSSADTVEKPVKKRSASDPKPKLDVGEKPTSSTGAPEKPSIPWIEDPE